MEGQHLLEPVGVSHQCSEVSAALTLSVHRSKGTYVILRVYHRVGSGVSHVLERADYLLERGTCQVSQSHIVVRFVRALRQGNAHSNPMGRERLLEACNI